MSPKYIQPIDKETIILWFQSTNRYIVISETLLTLLNLFLSVENKSAFKNVIHKTLDIQEDACEAIYKDISNLLDDANKVSETHFTQEDTIKIPKTTIERFYNFRRKNININFESTTIEGLIHPQIAHHSISKVSDYETTFDMFKMNDDLYLYKDKTYIGHYSTSTFHLLQGKFALELTNVIHDKQIEDWVATFHASTVTNGTEAIMIIGDSGNGKSTLSALLMAHGLDVLADDFTPLHKDMNLYRYPAAISIKKGAFNVLKTQIQNFESLKTITNGPKKVNLKYLAPISEFEKSEAYMPCQKIVYVKFDASKTSTLKEISTGNILETLIPDSWISPNEHHALQFINWLKQLRCFELNYSDTDFAITKFKRLFDE